MEVFRCNPGSPAPWYRHGRTVMMNPDFVWESSFHEAKQIVTTQVYKTPSCDFAISALLDPEHNLIQTGTIFLTRKCRIAIGRPINIPEQLHPHKPPLLAHTSNQHTTPPPPPNPCAHPCTPTTGVHTPTRHPTTR